ncbi:SurA N-terminal domain-containing protein [Geomobilimonas luticola]|uniref:Periplasmic chaperone PpiD n=1 Tax=Geomobilimonas luticola TaxID=1114878 RepID=A0ABS5SF81_9BACT|nr:SurA N-terminal domain-containing protein [Geomobilimonas luticola]MBT0654007.1 SurA N-terminal domain-containing protein [Geomobilimonas luticola]
MLGIMRKYKQSIVIKIVFGIIVLSFVGTIFLVWGRGDSTPGGKLGYAAKVDGTRISLEDFQKSYYRIKNVYEQVYGRSLTPEMEKQMGVKKMALDNLVDALLVRKEAGRMGIKVSKEEVASAIAAMPEFQKNGTFDFQQYQQLLKASRITPNDFEASQKEDLLVKKARQKIRDNAQVSDDEALKAFKKQRDKVDLQFVSYAPADVRNEIKLSEQELTAYLQSHQQEFKAPEQISISYALLDPAKVTSKVAVTDEEIQTYYQKNIDRYQGKGGILPFAEVKERVKTDALKAKGAKQAYEMAADAANKHLKGADLAAAAASLGVKVAETPLFTAAAPAAVLASETELLKRAFTLKEGELGGPVETAKGVYIFKIKERKPAAVPPLAQIRERVESRAVTDKAKELAKKKAEEALAALAKDGSALKVGETGSFGYAATGDVPKIGKSPEIMEAAFALDKGQPAAKTPFQVGDRWYAVKLKNRQEADTAEFQKSKEQLKQTLLPKKQQEALDNWLKELKTKAKIEINQPLIAD